MSRSAASPPNPHRRPPGAITRRLLCVLVSALLSVESRAREGPGPSLLSRAPASAPFAAVIDAPAELFRSPQFNEIADALVSTRLFDDAVNRLRAIDNAAGDRVRVQRLMVVGDGVGLVTPIAPAQSATWCLVAQTEAQDEKRVLERLGATPRAKREGLVVYTLEQGQFLLARARWSPPDAEPSTLFVLAPSEHEALFYESLRALKHPDPELATRFDREAPVIARVRWDDRSLALSASPTPHGWEILALEPQPIEPAHNGAAPNPAVPAFDPEALQRLSRGSLAMVASGKGALSGWGRWLLGRGPRLARLIEDQPSVVILHAPPGQSTGAFGVTLVARRGTHGIEEIDAAVAQTADAGLDQQGLSVWAARPEADRALSIGATGSGRDSRWRWGLGATDPQGQPWWWLRLDQAPGMRELEPVEPELGSPFGDRVVAAGRVHPRRLIAAVGENQLASLPLVRAAGTLELIEWSVSPAPDGGEITTLRIDLAELVSAPPAP